MRTMLGKSPEMKDGEERRAKRKLNASADEFLNVAPLLPFLSAEL